MKKVALGGKNGVGKFMLVDNEDFESINGYKWSVTKTGYAQAHIPNTGCAGKPVLAHTLIMNTPKGLEVDHINGNKLDNRKSKLRIVTKQQNYQNQGKRLGCYSKYKGVSWNKRSKKWLAYICLNYKLIHLGYFSDEIEAGKAYDTKAKELFGEFAKLNFNI